MNFYQNKTKLTAMVFSRIFISHFKYSILLWQSINWPCKRLCNWQKGHIKNIEKTSLYEFRYYKTRHQQYYITVPWRCTKITYTNKRKKIQKILQTIKRKRKWTFNKRKKEKKKTYIHGLLTAIYITFQLVNFPLTILQLTFQVALQLTETKYQKHGK